MQPKFDYAPVGSAGASAAYRVGGAGPRAVYASNWLSNLDALDDVEPLRAFYRGLESFCTLLYIDQLGVGQSDVVELEVLGDRRVWADTIAAVLNAEGWSSASVIGYDQSALAQIAFAAAYPERIEKLVLVNPIASWAGSETVPPIYASAIDETIDVLMSVWATPDYLPFLCPSAGDDADLCDRWARWHRSCLSPRRAREMFGMVMSSDVSDLLELVTCPTLIIDTNPPPSAPAQSAALAALIPDARLVTLPFGDQFPMRPADTRAILAEISEFLTGGRPEAPTRRALTTMCFTDIVGSTQRARSLGDREWVETLTDHYELVAAIVSNHRGEVVKRMGDGVLTTFATPSEAIEASTAIRSALQRFDLEIRAGIHTGEVEIAEDADLHGLAVHIAARIAAQAEPGEILVSAALVALTAGSHIAFGQPRTRDLAGIGEWDIVAVLPRR